MPTTSLESQGVQLKRGDAASPEVFTLVPQVVSLEGPGGSASEIDITTLDSTAREFRLGLADEGTITAELIHDPNHAQHTGLRSDRAARTLRNWQIVMTDSPATTWSFAGYVMEFTISNAVDAVQTARLSIRVSGAITES